MPGVLLPIAVALAFGLATADHLMAAADLKVAVIAPSISTARQARAIIPKQGWSEVPPKDAEAILVVVRSGLRYPLNASYDSFRELEQDAENQLNISGRNFHMYIYGFNNDLTVSELAHKSYPAE